MTRNKEDPITVRKSYNSEEAIKPKDRRSFRKLILGYDEEERREVNPGDSGYK
jgi:hypothetical protein